MWNGSSSGMPAPGEAPRMGIATKDVRDAFFGFLEPPRITSDEALRGAIVRGVGEGMFGYTTGTPGLGPDGKYQVPLAKVAISREMAGDEVDYDANWLRNAVEEPLDEANIDGLEIE